MRIVAGEYRGRQIQAPPSSLTRPTTDRVREALFSSLYSLRGGCDDAIVLDAFAGSGALGLEALSRGASWVSFYEVAPQALKVLKANVASCKGASERSRICKADVFKHRPSPVKQPFDLVFLDPPYKMDPDLVLGLVADLIAEGVVAPDAIVYYEHAKGDDSSVKSAVERLQWCVLVSKSYGDIAYDLLGKEIR